MTDATDTLTAIQQKFVLHWGEMGARWGINRTVAQVHALLFLSPKPLNAEEIATTLGVARSNVSTSLRELQGWGIVRPIHVLGDRRVHYRSLADVWELFRTIVDQRKRREVDPTVDVLRRLLADLDRDKSSDRYTRQRFQELLEFFETVTELYEEVRTLPPAALRSVAGVRGKVRKLLSLK